MLIKPYKSISMKFTLHFLPARYGDCIWIEYGNPHSLKRILIDGGTKGTKKNIRRYINALPAAQRRLELLVITHIDRDHIEGVLGLLEEDDPGIAIDQVWFNGWGHLPGNHSIEHFGPVQGERLSAAILKHTLPWNTDFNKGPVVLPANGDSRRIKLSGGLAVTLLSPGADNLAALKPEWDKEVRKANLNPGFGLQKTVQPGRGIEQFGAGSPDIEALASVPFHEDDAAPNGSSIAFLAEYGNKRVLLAGDAFPGVVLESLQQLFGNDTVPIDLFKLSHHASAHNTSPELLEKVQCKKFVVSTNGSIYKHPSRETIARVIKTAGGNAELIFNYRTKYNSIWDDQLLMSEYDYATVFPQDREGIKVDLL